MITEYFVVGYVLKPQGLKGEVKVKPATDSIERFEEIDTVLLKHNNDQFKTIKIIKRRYLKDFVILQFEGMQTIDHAESLRGKSLWIPRSKARKLSPDTFYIADIVGCIVENTDGVTIGKITRVLKTGSNDVYVIEDNQDELMIPALKNVVIAVDIESSKVIVDSSQIKEYTE